MTNNDVRPGMQTPLDCETSDFPQSDEHENVVDLTSYRDARFPDVDEIVDRLTTDTHRAARAAGNLG